LPIADYHFCRLEQRSLIVPLLLEYLAIRMNECGLQRDAPCVPTSPLCNCACNLPRNTACTHRHYSHLGEMKKNSMKKKKDMSTLDSQHSISACRRRLEEAAASGRVRKRNEKKRKKENKRKTITPFSIMR